MRLISLRSFKFLSPLRFNIFRRKFRFPESHKFPLRFSKNYLRISVPLTLMGLTYAISALSAKAYLLGEDGKGEQIGFEDLIQKVVNHQQALEKLQKHLITNLQNINILLDSAHLRLKQKGMNVEEILGDMKHVIDPTSNKTYAMLNELIDRRYQLRDKMIDLENQDEPDYDEAQKLFVQLYTNAIYLIPIISEFLEDTDKVIQKLVSEEYFKPELLEKKQVSFD